MDNVPIHRKPSRRHADVTLGSLGVDSHLGTRVGQLSYSIVALAVVKVS